MRYTHRVRFGVEHKLVLAAFLDLPRRFFRVGEVGVLQNLREEETLLVVLLRATVLSVHVGEGSKARLGAAGFVDSHEGVPDPIAVL